MDTSERMGTISSRMLIISSFINEFYTKTTFSTSGLPGANLTPALIKSLFAFEAPDREYPIGELGKNAGVKKSTITDMVDRLERQRIARRIRNSRDRRIVRVRLTAKGKRLRSDFIKKAGNAVENVFSKLDEKDTRRLLKALETAYRVLKKIE